MQTNTNNYVSLRKHIAKYQICSDNKFVMHLQIYITNRY